MLEILREDENSGFPQMHTKVPPATKEMAGR